MQTAYYLFRLHHVMPSDFEEMGFGEKMIVSAFLDYQINQMREESETAPMGKEDEQIWQGL